MAEREGNAVSESEHEVWYDGDGNACVLDDDGNVQVIDPAFGLANELD